MPFALLSSCSLSDLFRLFFLRYFVAVCILLDSLPSCCNHCIPPGFVTFGNSSPGGLG